MSDDMRELLQTQGLRCTPPRAAVLRALLAAKRPLSRQEIVTRLAKGAPDPVTVYRCLTCFTKAGLVHQSYVEDRAPRYETAHRCKEDRCHPHFTCRVCGKTACMNDAIVPLARNLDKGYVPERQKVLIEGVCPRCTPS